MIHLSYSELRDFKRCPYFYQLKHVEKMKESKDRDKRSFVGDVLQKLVEQFYVEEWWRNPLTLDEVMRTRALKLCRTYTDAGAIVWENDELFKWQHIIGEALPGIVETVKLEKLLTRRTYPEYEMTLVFPALWPDGQDVTVHGRSDFIFDQPAKSLTIVDGKGGATVGAYADRDQLRLYALAAERDPRFKRQPDRLGFWWYRHAQVVWIKNTAKAMAKFEDVLKARIREVAAAVYPPKAASHCRPCGLRLHCEVGMRYGVSKPATKGRPALDLDGNFGIIGF